ncbi:uncharacterized protein LOC126378507 [Pectinophora gossypiella]|uniref:uncharacterized protein LOC126378507 n=1 Tax=Pectinophora gossypiella TaxID=13191 RepID=UPI00214E487C|nr:uncharacterized protein LOC126378507 [Pectinophora gossypiella]
MNFTTKEEEKLIQVVGKHPVLYDRSLPEYRNIVTKENLWNDIAKELNKSCEDTKRKWKIIRDSYLRFKKNKRRTGSAGKNSKDERHHQLWFLDKDRPGSDQDPIAYDNDDTSQDFNEETPAETPSENIDQLVKVEIDERVDEVEPQKKLKCRTKMPPKTKRLAKFWKRRDKRVQSSVASKSNRDDDVELFSRHIAQVLRSLPPIYKAEAKKQLSITLSNYEIMAARNGSKDSSTE